MLNPDPFAVTVGKNILNFAQRTTAFVGMSFRLK